MYCTLCTTTNPGTKLINPALIDSFSLRFGDYQFSEEPVPYLPYTDGTDLIHRLEIVVLSLF